MTLISDNMLRSLSVRLSH